MDVFGQGNVPTLLFKNQTNPSLVVEAEISASSPSFDWANAFAFFIASAKPAGLLPVAWAEPALPPPLPSSRALTSATHSLALRPRSFAP